MKMKAKENLTTSSQEISLDVVAKKHRSHNLYVFSNALPDHESAFLDWFIGKYLQAVSKLNTVLTAHHFEQHELDIAGGGSKPIGYKYLGVYELLLDGAEEAEVLIDEITALYESEDSASNPATWLYYPVSEKVGQSPKATSPFMVLAFANPVKGSEAEFREWYSTQHLRHALIIPALVSGQRFELTGFQKPGAMTPGYNSIAVYEQQDTPENMITSLTSLELNKLSFSPSVDVNRFTEWIYRVIAS